MANEVEKGALYIVATPIGNLSDISDRAKKILSEVDLIAAEDTRVTSKLLAKYEIRKPMISYFEHNKKERGDEIISRLERKLSVALVSDAGTPAISDPGELLVKQCCEKNIPVYTVPGPCAAICALTLSGLFTGRFAFEGFLSVRKSERKARFCEIKEDKRTLIFYEAPHKLRETLADLLEGLGDRKISLARELTKINEEVIRTTISGAVKYYETTEPRGEYVLVVEGFSGQTAVAEPEEPAADAVRKLIGDGMTSVEAIKAVAKQRSVAKSVIYKEWLVSEGKQEQ